MLNMLDQVEFEGLDRPYFRLRRDRETFLGYKGERLWRAMAVKLRVDSRKGHLNEETFHTIIETLKHGYAIRSGLGLVLDVFESDSLGHVT